MLKGFYARTPLHRSVRHNQTQSIKSTRVFHLSFQPSVPMQPVSLCWLPALSEIQHRSVAVHDNQHPLHSDKMCAISLSSAYQVVNDAFGPVDALRLF